MKKILVTGGAGFIGSNLIKNLDAQNKFEITSLDCYFTGKKENHIKGINYVTGYTWDIEKIFPNTKFDLIYHFGEYSRIVKSFDDIEFVSNSILHGTPKVFDFARKCRSKIIYSASSSKFGNNGKDENLSPYSWMKSKMVELLKNYNSWFDLDFEISYFFNVYGKRQIYDLDGDGVEDNVKRTRDELDDFYYPNQFGDAGDDIYNTHHGNLPGHLRLEEYEMPPAQVKLYKFNKD